MKSSPGRLTPVRLLLAAAIPKAARVTTTCSWMVLSSTLLLVDGLAHGQGRFENPVVRSATLGPYTHGKFPSLESRGQQWTHLGVDLIAPAGAAVYAFGDGTVDKVITKDDPEHEWAGHAVMLRHAVGSESLYSIYLHLQGPLRVKPGDQVRGGQTQIGSIGRLGESGHAYGAPHVHFEIRRFPEWLSRWGNIYAPGDQRNAAYLKASWEDPVKWFKQHPKGLTARGGTPGRPGDNKGSLGSRANEDWRDYFPVNQPGAEWIFRQTLTSKTNPGVVRSQRYVVRYEGDTQFSGTKVAKMSFTDSRDTGEEIQQQIRYVVSSAEGLFSIGGEHRASNSLKRYQCEPRCPMLKLPIQSGAGWTYQGLLVDDSGTGRPYTERATLSRERVDIPVGTFEALKVSHSSPTQGYASGTNWLAKGVGLVRREVEGPTFKTVAELIYHQSGSRVMMARFESLDQVDRYWLLAERAVRFLTALIVDYRASTGLQLRPVSWNDVLTNEIIVLALDPGGALRSPIIDRSLEGGTIVVARAKDPIDTRRKIWIAPAGAKDYVSIAIDPVAPTRGLTALCEVLIHMGSRLHYQFACERDVLTEKRDEIRAALDRTVRAVSSGR